MPEIKTEADLAAAFKRGDKLVRNSVITGVERLLNFTASKAQKNVRLKKKGAAVGGGASLVQSIGAGAAGIRKVTQTISLVTGKIGTKLDYGAYLEFGTGIYGPKRTPIVPKRAKILAWKITTGTQMVPGVSASGKATSHRQRTSDWIFAKSVKGTRPWKWLSGALNEIKPRTLGVLVNAAREVGL